VTTPGVVHLSADERRAQGKEARKRTPRESHGDWVPATNRPDPVAMLEAQDADREPDLVPVRHGRMMVSPFTFTGAQRRSWRWIWRCADQNDKDFAAFTQAVRSGRIEAREGV